MKMTLISLIVFCQLTAYANDRRLLSELKRQDPEFASRLEQINEKILAQVEEKIEQISKEMTYQENLERLVRLGAYAQTRGHWLLDMKIVQTWLVPTTAALAGFYAQMRHIDLRNAAAIQILTQRELTTEQKNAVFLSGRARFASALMGASIFGGIAYIATEVKRTRELKALDALSEEDVVSQYEILLCATNRLGRELHQPEIRNYQTGKPPVCR